MGSLNSDGTRISQSREMVRNIGRAHTVSADRAETETNLDQSPEAASDELGTNADLTTSQYSAVAQSKIVKITTPVDDELILREYEREIESPVHQNPPWVGLGGGGGASDLESVLAEGNTGSGIVLSESLTTPLVRSPTTMTPLVFKLTDNIYIEIGDGIYLQGKFGAETDYISIGGGIWIEADGNNDVNITAADALNLSGKLNWTSSNGSQIVEDANGVLDIQAGATEENITLNQNTIVSSNGIYVNGIVNGRRDVEVITMASGQSIELTSASGQVIVVKGSDVRELSLPSGTSLGLIYDIKDGDGTASSGNITVQGNGANIDGESSFAIDTNYASYTFVFNGTEWNLI